MRNHNYRKGGIRSSKGGTKGGKATGKEKVEIERRLRDEEEG